MQYISQKQMHTYTLIDTKAFSWPYSHRWTHDYCHIRNTLVGMEALVCSPYIHKKYLSYVTPYSWTNVHCTNVFICQHMNICIYTNFFIHVQSNYIHIIILTFLI